MQIQFYFHAGEFPVIQLREIPDAVFNVKLSDRHPDEIESELTGMLKTTKVRNPGIHQQMFAVVDSGENAQIIGAEVTRDHSSQTPQMRYLKQSMSHQSSDKIAQLKQP